MSRIIRCASALVASLCLLALAGAARGQEKMSEAAAMITAAADAVTYAPIPGFPKGTDIAVVRGDPAKGAFDCFIRIQPGVRIPMHFHSSAESSVGVQGAFALEMADGTKKTLKPGVYTFIPWKMQHAASCAAGGTACIGYFAFDRAFDVTWIEAPPADPNPMPGESR